VGTMTIRSARLVQAVLASWLICAIGLSVVASGASEASAAGTVIKSVRISGKVSMGGITNPKVTIKGEGFGTAPPVGLTNSRGYTGNDYEGGMYFYDQTGVWGAGDAGSATCIGLTNLVWSGTKITFNFGSGYGQAPPNPVWWLHRRDKASVTVQGVIFNFTVK